MMNILLKTVGLLFFPCLVFADTQCIAVKVSDGDTFTCNTYQRLIQVRLADLDAPESGQAYGNQARKKLNSLIYKKKRCD
ncbi:MAG: hypothetical protein IJ143_06065 [Neisseriaceae bacterium]|nr:hypothetical protein [Neisseriaceae bacterium]